MKPNLIYAILFLIIISITIFEGCTKDKTPRPVDNSVPCDPNKVYFQTQVMPIFNSNCAMSGCHDAATSQKGVNLSSYDGIRAQVKPGKPADSKIIKMINESKPEERMPPPPGIPLTTDQKNLISKWISQGADNAVCTQDSAGCTPANVSFASTIQPIINGNCMGCHSGNTISGGVNLSNFGGIQVVAQSGKLVNAVSQNGQATPMPQNGKLSACDINKIKIWVDEGYKNN